MSVVVKHDMTGPPTDASTCFNFWNSLQPDSAPLYCLHSFILPHCLLYILALFIPQMSVDDESSGWQLTESDPGVFTYVVIKYGNHQYDLVNGRDI